MKGGVCGQHDSMLEKSEFRWVFGFCFAVAVGASSFMWHNTASNDQLAAIDEKVEYKEDSAERRALRIEKQMEKLNAKLDKIHEYLRGGPSEVLYR